MGAMDCCQRGVNKELIIEADQDQINDKEGYPQDTDPAFRAKKIELENPIENINNTPFEEAYKQEEENNNNNYVVEVGESDMKEIEQNEQAENYENNEPNDNTNIPNADVNVIHESNNEYNIPANTNEIVDNLQNIGSQGIDTNIVQGELNIDQLLNNYNEQQVEQNQNIDNEDYNKYFEQNQAQPNNNDIDINQYFNNNNVQTNATNNLTPMFTFGGNQTDLNNLINSNNEANSQEYKIDYNFNIQNA